MSDYGEFSDLVPKGTAKRPKKASQYGEFSDLVPQGNVEPPSEIDETTGTSLAAEPRSTGVSTDWEHLSSFAGTHGLTVTGKNEKQGHNVNSRHYIGQAIDVRTRDRSPKEIAAFIKAAQAKGIRVVDERSKPKGQAVWTGPHLHLEIGDRKTFFGQQQEAQPVGFSGKEYPQDKPAVTNPNIVRDRPAPKIGFTAADYPAGNTSAKVPPKSNKPLQEFGQPNVIQQFQKSIDIKTPEGKTAAKKLAQEQKKLTQEQKKKPMAKGSFAIPGLGNVDWVQHGPGYVANVPVLGQVRAPDPQSLAKKIHAGFSKLSLQAQTEAQAPSRAAYIESNPKAMPGNLNPNDPFRATDPIFGTAIRDDQERFLNSTAEGVKMGYLRDNEKKDLFNKRVSQLGELFSGAAKSLGGHTDPLGGTDALSQLVASALASPMGILVSRDIAASPNFTPLERVGAAAEVLSAAALVDLPVSGGITGPILQKLWGNLGNTTKFKAALKEMETLGLGSTTRNAIESFVEKNPGLEFKGLREDGKPIFSVKSGVGPVEQVAKVDHSAEIAAKKAELDARRAARTQATEPKPVSEPSVTAPKATPTETVKPTQGQKEPWEIVRTNFLPEKTVELDTSLMPKSSLEKRYGKNPTPEQVAKYKAEQSAWRKNQQAYKKQVGASNAAWAQHRASVESALKEGKPVPKEVLADYPDLAAKYGKKEPAVSTQGMTPTPNTPKPIEAPQKPVQSPETGNATGPLGMDGLTRSQRKAANTPPKTELPPLHPKAVEGLNNAIEKMDVDALKQWLHPDNKRLRAMYEEKTGVKLPKTARDTNALLDRLAIVKKSVSEDLAKGLSPEQAQSNALSKLASVDAEIAAVKARRDARLKSTTTKGTKQRGAADFTKEDFQDALELAELYVKKVGYTFEQYAKEMVDYFGDGVKPHLKEIWDTHAPKAPEMPRVSVPKVDAKPGEATGVANQQAARERAAGTLKGEEVNVKGKSIKEQHDAGKKLYESGEIDIESTMRKLADEGRNGTGVEYGAATAHKAKLLREMNAARQEVDDAITAGNNPRIYDAQQRLAKAERDANDWQNLVDETKTNWSDSGRGLQIGTTINEGDFAQVILERRRKLGRDLTKREKDVLSKHVDDFKKAVMGKGIPWSDDAEELLSNIEKFGTKNVERTKAEVFIQQQVRRTRPKDIEGLRKARSEAVSRITQKITKATAQAGAGPGQAFADLVEAIPEIVDDIKIIIRSIAEEHKLNKLDKQLFDSVRRELPGMEITDDEIVKVLAKAYDEKVSKEPTLYEQLARQARKRNAEPLRQAQKQAQEELRKAKAEAAKLENSALKEDRERLTEIKRTMKKLEDRLDTLDDIEEQIKSGGFWESVKKVKDVTKEQQLLDLTIKGKRRQIQGLIRERDMGRFERAAQGTADFARSLRLGSDAGMLLRQGMYTLGRGKATAAGLRNFVKALGDEDAWTAINESYYFKETPDGKLLQPIRDKAKLAVSDIYLDPEEIRVLQILKKLPGLEHTVGSLERAQSAFINTVRREIFDEFVTKFPDATLDELKARARFINAATGRSNWKDVPGTFKFLMTSPRYTYSRWELFGEMIRNPATLSSRASRENLKDLGATAGSVLAALKLMEAVGFDVSWDPMDSEFLKVRYGKNVYDPTAGLGKVARSVFRSIVVFNKYKNGEDVPHGMDLRDIVGAVLSDTVSPVITGTVTGVTGKTLAGYDAKPTEKGFWLALPLLASGFAESLSEDGVGAAFGNAVPEFFGIGVNRYSSSKLDSAGRPHDAETVKRDEDVLRELTRLGMEGRLPPKLEGESQDEQRARAKAQGDYVVPLLREFFKSKEYQNIPTKIEREIRTKQRIEDYNAKFYGQKEWSLKRQASTEAKRKATQSTIETQKAKGIK